MNEFGIVGASRALMEKKNDQIKVYGVDFSDDVLPLLNGDVQKALDAFENTKEQFASEVSFDLIDEGMEHDMVYIIRTDLNK